MKYNIEEEAVAVSALLLTMALVKSSALRRGKGAIWEAGGVSCQLIESRKGG